MRRLIGEDARPYRLCSRRIALEDATAARRFYDFNSTAAAALPTWWLDSGHHRAKSMTKASKALRGVARTVIVLMTGGTEMR